MDYLVGDAVDMAGFAYANGPPPRVRGRLRVEPADFVVDEDCSIVLDEAGEHIWLWVEKTGLTTPECATRLSSAIGVHPRYIGYSGLKDRHAVTRQWFSVAWPIKSEWPEWPQTDAYRVLRAVRHGRKLKRGAHRGNRFTIRIKDCDRLDADQLAFDIARIRREGVPNYFGPQRFGHGGHNIELARRLFDGRRLSRNRRGFALSAARSLLFNAVLDTRIRRAAWHTPLSGDVFMLAGSHSMFAARDSGQSDQDLATRVACRDIVPTGPMPGRISPQSIQPSGDAARLEADVLAATPLASLVDGLEVAGVDTDRRPLCLMVDELDYELDDHSLVIRFYLPTGAFATSVLRELIQTDEVVA